MKSTLGEVRRLYEGNFDEDYPLHVAVDNDDIERVKFLVLAKVDSSIKIAGCIEKLTPLMIAVKKNSTSMVQLLLELGLDVNKKNEHAFFKTPLYAAVQQENVEIANMLLVAKADPNQGCWHEAPLHAAVHQHIRGVRLCLADKQNISKNSSLGKKSLNGTNVDNYEKSGLSAMIQLLLAYGADVTLQDTFGKTPLQVALGLYFADFAELLKKGPDFIKGVRASLNAFAMVLHVRCGNGSIAHLVCQPHIVAHILSCLKPGLHNTYDPNEVGFYANVYSRQMSK